MAEYIDRQSVLDIIYNYSEYASYDGLCSLHSEQFYKEPCHDGPCMDMVPLTKPTALGR